MSKEKLKIAVCFFGHLRSYQKCAPLLRWNLLKYYDCDLFMHTWSTLDHNTKIGHDLKKMTGITRPEDIARAYGNISALAIEEQKPKDLGVIKIKIAHDIRERQMSIFGIGAMFHSMRESMRLCDEYAAKNKVEYDYVLFIRPDIWLKKPLRIEKLLQSISPGQRAQGFFTFANFISQTTAGFKDMGAVDVCFFGTPATMSDIIKNNELAVKQLKPDMKMDHCPEYILIKLLEERGFTPYRIEGFRMPEDWDILRISKAIKLRKRIISLRIRGNMFRLWLFPKMMRRIVNMQLDLFGIFKIDLSIGNPGHETRDI